MSVPQQVEALVHLLATSTDTAFVLKEVHRSLSALRDEYRVYRARFTPEHIAFLKAAAQLGDALEDFYELLEEKSTVRCKEDAEDLVGQFAEVASRMGTANAVHKRAEKEERELLELYAKLPSRSTERERAETNNAVARLASSAPICPRCNVKLVLRFSHYGYFWGCIRFPACRVAAKLTREQAARMQ